MCPYTFSDYYVMYAKSVKYTSLLKNLPTVLYSKQDDQTELQFFIRFSTRSSDLSGNGMPA